MNHSMISSRIDFGAFGVMFFTFSLLRKHPHLFNSVAIYFNRLSIYFNRLSIFNMYFTCREFLCVRYYGHQVQYP